MSEMPDEGLEEYVRDQLAKGEKVEKIRKNLLNKGYPAEKVDKAINFATAREPGSSPVLETLHQRRTRRAQERAKEEDLVPKKISFFKKLSLVIRKPSIFFEIMKHEPGTAKAILYFVTFSIIILLLQIGIPVIKTFAVVGPPEAIIGGITGAFGIASYLLVYIISLSVFSLVVFLVSRIFRSQVPYNMSFKSVVYAQTPVLLFGVILILLDILFYLISRLFTFEFPLLANIQQYLMIIAGVWSLILMVIGVTRMHEFSFVKGILTLVISFGIILGVLYLVFIVLLGFPLSISSLTDLLGETGLQGFLI